MSDITATDVILVDAGKSLLPLARIKTPEQAVALLHELGYAFPGVENLEQAFSSAGAAVGPVMASIDALASAETLEDVLESSDEVFGAVNAAVKAIDGIGSALQEPIGALSGFDPQVLSELPRRLLDYLLIMHLLSSRGEAYGLLVFIGLIESKETPAAPERFQPDFVLRKVNWERLPTLVTGPDRLIRETYGWGVDFADRLFLDRLYLVMRLFGIPSGFYVPSPEVRAGLALDAHAPPELRIPLVVSGTWPTHYAEAGISITSSPAAIASDKGLALVPYLLGQARGEMAIDGNWTLTFAASADLEPGIAVEIHPSTGLTLKIDLSDSPVTPDVARLQVALGRKAKLGESIVLIGKQDGSRIAASTLALSLLAEKLGKREDVGLELSVEGAEAVIDVADADGFLQTVLPPEGLRAEFELGIAWSRRQGLHFRGSGGLEATLPVQADLLGALKVNSIYLVVKAAEERVDAALGATVTLTLGPVTAVVERFGLQAEVAIVSQGGNLGPIDVALDFRPPSGAALKVDTGIAVGGGYLFFDPKAEQYAGVLQLELGGKVAVKAVGLLTTRMPDGSPGFSLLLIITAEGFGSIQLGFGFTLEGVGGLIGVNRTVNVEALRGGIRTGVLDSILFPSDPARNAPALVSNVGAVMPPAAGRFLVGPMVLIGWGTPTILTLKLAILVELPDPVRLAILGRLAARLPSVDAPVVRLQMDAIGIVDFERGEVSLDATLFDSRVLAFVLTGDMALRARWGADPTFVLSVGGFNPRYPVPAGFPRLERLALSLAESPNFRLRLAAYLAITSNSVQFGARADLYAGAGGFEIVGHVGFDALFQFDPFRFVTDFSAGIALKAGGAVIMSIQLEAVLAGPTPWHVRGAARFEILGIKLAVEIDQRFGPADPPPLPEAVDVETLVRAALADVRNWSAELPPSEHPLVSLRDRRGGQLLAHPLSTVTVRQRVVPLNRTISRFGNTVPRGARSFRVDVAAADGRPLPPVETVRDAFPRAHYETLSDDEKLTLSAFLELDAGFRVGSAAVDYPGALALSDAVQYETLCFDPVLKPDGAVADGAAPYSLSSDVLDRVAILGAAGQSELGRTAFDRYRTNGAAVAAAVVR